jgi:integrase
MPKNDNPGRPPNTPVALSDAKIRAAKPRKAQYKIFDGNCKGLYLVVTPNRSKLWRLRYWFEKREKTLSIGPYPQIGLNEARQRVLEARTLLTHGKDPTVEKKAQRAHSIAAGRTFKEVALEWFGKYSPNWTRSYREMVLARLERQLFPWLGDRPANAITAPELLTVLRRIESRGAIETAHRVLQHASVIFRYAVASGLVERDPAGDLRGALAPTKVQHYAALTEPKKVGELMRSIDGYQGSFVVACALKLAPLLFVRPSELRRMEWSEIDFEASEWRIPAIKMKMRDPHIVPLSKQAVAVLRELQPLTGSGRYCFPSERTTERPMSENTVGSALRRLGYSTQEMTSHGFRAMAFTLLNELGFPPDVIERQLAHAERNKIRAAYNRAEYLDERRTMMQSWSDYLDGLKQGGKVIPINRAGSDKNLT